MARILFETASTLNGFIADVRFVSGSVTDTLPAIREAAGDGTSG